MKATSLHVSFFAPVIEGMEKGSDLDLYYSYYPDHLPGETKSRHGKHQWKVLGMNKFEIDVDSPDIIRSH